MGNNSENNKIRVFAPATVANVGPGYDILGFALEEIGDEISMRKKDSPGIVIERIDGAEGIPTDPKSNVCSVSIQQMLDKLNSDQGFALSIRKNIQPGSGLGSSASSSAAAVFAANELLERPFHRNDLVEFAMKGEELASGKPHADNVAPSLLGGFTVIRSYQPLDVFKIPYPESLRVIIIFPALEVKTADAKKILKKQISMPAAITQWGNVAGLVSGLIMTDFGLIERSIKDVIVEPVRSMLIPYYDAVKQICLENGAIGFNISGSGPSMFCLLKDETHLVDLKTRIEYFYRISGLDVQLFTSKINSKGAIVL